MARFGQLIDMGRSPEEVKEQIEQYANGPLASAPIYPYGLCISLTEEELGKLGLEGELPEVGDMIHIAAMAKVTSVSENEKEMADGEKKRCVRIELQITHLSPLENEDDEFDDDERHERRKRFYGGADDKAA